MICGLVFDKMSVLSLRKVESRNINERKSVLAHKRKKKNIRL
jgi:hypothetical protein